MGTQWEYSSNLTGVYFDVLHKIATYNMTLFVRWCSCHHHNFLLQLCHSQILPGSFQCFGSHSSALTVIPFNQGSKQDVEVLVDYIYMTLGLDLDYVILLLLFLRMATRLTVWMTSLSSCTVSCLWTSCIILVLSRLRRWAIKLLPTRLKLSFHPLYYKPKQLTFAFQLAATETSDSLPPRVLIGLIKQATLCSHWLSCCSSPYPLPHSMPGLCSTLLAFPSKFHGLHTAHSFFPTYHDQVCVYFLTQSWDITSTLAFGVAF